MAQRVWHRHKSNDSLECRNCHSETAMDFTRQSKRAADAHERFLVTGEKTCIDCHKGISHDLPKTTAGGMSPYSAELKHYQASTRSSVAQLIQAKGGIQAAWQHPARS